MSAPRRHHKHPEFAGLEKFVWEYLNGPGKPVSQISLETCKSAPGDPKHRELREYPIWHDKPGMDEFVARSLNLRMADYGEDLSRNALYKEIANEVRRLRQRKALIDWNRTKKGRGTGIWRLDKTLFGGFVYENMLREIRDGDYYSDGLLTEITTRQKQEAFRDELLCEYRRCAFCGFGMSEYMIAAHIVPYSVMRRQEPANSMNPSNGLLLCRLCDVAFEKGSVMVETDLAITISESLHDSRDDAVVSWRGLIVPEVRIGSNHKYPPDPKYLRWKKRLLRQNLPA